MAEQEIKHLHVELSPDEKALLVKWRGKLKWKKWLLSIPQRLRDAADAKEKAELRLEIARRDITDLQDRCKRLQKELEECEHQKEGSA